MNKKARLLNECNHLSVLRYINLQQIICLNSSTKHNRMGNINEK